MKANKPLQSPLRDANERRRHPRKGSRLLTRYQIGGKEHVGYVIDISPGGLCLETTRAHGAGEEVALQLELVRGEALVLVGRIVSVQQKDPRRWWLGVRFNGLEAAVREAILTYLG